MSELSALLAIYKAVDQRAQEIAAGEAEGSLEKLAEVIPAYGEGVDEVFDWWGKLGAALNEHVDDSYPLDLGIPDLDAALDELAGIQPRGAARARRLHALSALHRVGLDTGKPRDELVDAALHPLVHEEPRTAGTDNKAELRRVLAGDAGDVAPSGEGWIEFLESVNGLVDDVTFSQKAPPCEDSLVWVDLDGTDVLAVLLETDFEADAVTMADLTEYLDPSNWPSCSDFWVSMNSLLGGWQPGQSDPVPWMRDNFSETVGDPDGGWVIPNVCLQFRKFDLPRTNGGIGLDYQMCAPHNLVTVDEGIIHAVPAGPNSVQVRSTKRLRFQPPIEGGALAMAACALGYLDAAKDMVYKCAKGDISDPLPGGT